MQRTTFAFLACLGVAAACGSTGQVTLDASSSGKGGELTGASSSRASSTVASSVAANSSGGGAGGKAPSGPPYPIVLAHGFFGFEQFAGLDFVTYFYGVKDDLKKNGVEVHTPAVDPFNDSTTRGAQLYTAIQDILAKTGAAKVNIVGHSQGGLDARVVAHDHPEVVASVVTIATPHHGTPIADILVKLLSDPNAQQITDAIVKLIGAPLYDKIGNSTSVVKPLELFSQPGITAFNAKYPDAANVFYASIAGRTALAGDGGDCSPDKPTPITKLWTGDLDPIDPGLAIVEPVLSGGIDGIVNDGLVRVRDAKWGEFWGCVPADHLDEVGQLLGDSPGLGNSFDYKQFYRKIVAYLRLRGY